MLSSGLWAPALIGILCLFRRVRWYVGNSRGIYLGVLDLSFISVLLFQCLGHFYLFLTF